MCRCRASKSRIGSAERNTSFSIFYVGLRVGSRSKSVEAARYYRQAQHVRCENSLCSRCAKEIRLRATSGRTASQRTRTSPPRELYGRVKHGPIRNHPRYFSCSSTFSSSHSCNPRHPVAVYLDLPSAFQSVSTTRCLPPPSHSPRTTTSQLDHVLRKDAGMRDTCLQLRVRPLDRRA